MKFSPRHLRLYESLQMMVPGLLGFIAHYPAALLGQAQSLFYLGAYFFHLFSGYCHNDLCDFKKDRLNPRRAGQPAENLPTLKIITPLAYLSLMACLMALPPRLKFLFIILTGLGIWYNLLNRRILLAVPVGQLLHFVGGGGHFFSGILVFNSPVDPKDYWGIAAFGLTYLAGGTLNELIDRQYDKSYGTQTLSTLLNPETVFTIILFVQAMAVIALNAFFPTAVLGAASLGAGLFHLIKIRRFRGSLDRQDFLLGFRRRSRLYFGLINIVVIALNLLPKRHG